MASAAPARTAAASKASGTVSPRSTGASGSRAPLTAGGLRAGIGALASRMPVPVEVAVAADRLPAPIEATAYFVVAEALTNVAKHARARAAAVTVWVQDETLAVEVVDNGIGGARPDGTGLVGLADRVATVAGDLVVETPLCGGTRVTATME